MANPDNALGTNGAYGGRTSVNAFNDVLAGFTGRGILSGWECVPDTGLTVTLGGNGTDRDVALAEDNSGNKTTINNISQAPVPATLPAAPATNSRIDAIVAYIESSPSTNAETDNYSAVNLLVVSGTAASTPVAPNDNKIRTAITADGTSGATAYYVVLATVKLPSGTTDIDATMISAGPAAQIGAEQIGDSSITSDKIDFSTIGTNCVMNHDDGTSISVPFTPKVSGGIIEVEAMTGSTWGYAGQTIGLYITTPSGLTRVSYHDGALVSGDTIGRQMLSRAIFSGATADTTYTFEAYAGGITGRNPDISIVVRYYPGN